MEPRLSPAHPSCSGRPEDAIPAVSLKDRQVQLKIVFHGPALSGKTTNLEALHELADPSSVTDLIQLKTEGDRTLFFDLLPFELVEVAGLTLRARLFTVPGQPHHAATRRLVLRGADAVVFVGDMDPARSAANAASLTDLGVHLSAMGVAPGACPIVIQANKCDLPDALPMDRFIASLNVAGLGPHAKGLAGQPIVASALSGLGVAATFESVLGVTLRAARERDGGRSWRALEQAVTRALAPWHERRRRVPAPSRRERGGASPASPETSSQVPSAAVPALDSPPADATPSAEALLQASLQRSVALAEALGDQRLVEAAMRRRVTELETIGVLSRALASRPDENEIAAALARAARIALPGGLASVMLETESGELREAALDGLPAEPLLAAGRSEFLKASLGSSTARLLRDREVATLLGTAPLPGMPEGPTLLALAPLDAGGRRRGLACVYGTCADRVDAEGILRYMSAVASSAGLALDNASQRTRLVVQQQLLKSEVAARTAELSRAHDEIVALSQMKDRILATVDHELRTPVTQLLLSAQVLERHVGGAPPPPALLSGIMTSARRLGKLIDQVLCARVLLSPEHAEAVGPDDAGTTDMVRAIHAAILTCKDQAITRHVEICEPLVPVELASVVGDGGTVTLALSAVLDNAVKFTAPKTAVIVSLSRQGEGFVRVSVTDQGPGLRPEDRERVFEQMDQGSASWLTDKPAGLGLGLAMARRAVRRLGGDVGVDEPDPGMRGATFWLDLPLAHREAPTAVGG